MTKLETVLTAQMFLNNFPTTTQLSKYLQTSFMSILHAQRIVNVTLETLKHKSRNLEDVIKATKKFFLSEY